MTVPAADDYEKARQLAADAADRRNSDAYRAELRELAQVHATLALTAVIARAIADRREAP